MIMSSRGKFWHGLADSLKKARQRASLELVLVVAILPVIENVLTAMWFSVREGQSGAGAGIMLLLVAVLHLYLGYLVYAGQAACPQGLIADAVELEARHVEQQAELQRRELTYRLAREAFDKLNRQTCSITDGYFGWDTQDTGRWCFGGFQQGLEPILRPFLAVADHTFGIRGVQFTLEAWFLEGTVAVIGESSPPKEGLEMHFCFGTYVELCAPICSNVNCSPCVHGHRSGRAYEHHIESDRQFFYEGDQIREDVYFRRYAVCPIRWPCSDEHLGVLVLTSMQNEPFAEDVLDTMAFLCTLIANYHHAYGKCYDDEEAEPDRLAKIKQARREMQTRSSETAVDGRVEPKETEPSSGEK